MKNLVVHCRCLHIDQVPVGVYQRHLHGKVLIVDIGSAECLVDALSCSKNILVGQMIFEPFCKTMGKIWLKKTKIHISGTAYHVDLVDTSI